MHSKRFKEGDERAPLPALSPKKTRNAPCALPCGANLTLLLPDDVMLLVTTAAAVPPAATVSHAPQVLRGAAYDPKLAATVALVCRRWHELCSSDDFYRRVELLALAGSAVRPSHAPMIEMLEQRLARPRYRSVCEVSLRAVALSQPLFHAISRALPGLSCISFSGCSALTAQPLIDVLPSLPSLRSLDFSSCSCTSRDASPVAPKWIALVMRAAPALTSLDVQSCLEFTTESLKNLATTTRSSLTLLNISYTSAKIHSPSLFRLLVCCTPELREFYCCGLSLPYLAHARARDGAERWSQLRTLSAGCQRNSHSFSDQVYLFFWGLSPRVRFLIGAHTAAAACERLPAAPTAWLFSAAPASGSWMCVMSRMPSIHPVDVARLQVQARFRVRRCGRWPYAASKASMSHTRMQFRSRSLRSLISCLPSTQYRHNSHVQKQLRLTPHSCRRSSASGAAASSR